MSGAFRRIKTLPRIAWLMGGFWCVSAVAQISERAPIIDVSDDQIEAAFRRLRRNDSLQFDLPGPPPTPPTPGWLRVLGEFLIGLFQILAPLLKILFWIGIGALIFGALYLLAQTIYDAAQARKGRNEKSEVAPSPPLYQPAQQQARILLEEVDALAAQGRYDEAVHILLFRSIQDIDLNRPNVIRRSLTSREIGALSILTKPAQDAFSLIAQIVEQSFFGGQALGRVEFDRARTAYSALAMEPAKDEKAAA